MIIAFLSCVQNSLNDDSSVTGYTTLNKASRKLLNNITLGSILDELLHSFFADYLQLKNLGLYISLSIIGHKNVGNRYHMRHLFSEKN